MRSFFRELRRRNVYKVGAMYAVGGWLLVQIATQVLPIFEVSALAQRLIVLVIVAGFPVALVLSWIYEVTPQGIVRTTDVEPDQSITHHTGRKINLVTIVVLALAVVFLLAQRYLFAPRVGTIAVVPEKSVAVLPFESLSDDKANAYFAVGIQDEILTRLAKIGALKVISRTSTQHYASSPTNLPEIARELGVANILEGSVQKVGDAVHINVQLIRAATDDHLWAEIYNRKLDDIFGVEGEVANAIAETLNAKLSGTEQAAVTRKPTDNPAAYDAYLRAIALSAQGYDYGTVRNAITALNEAVRLDPKFVEAWSRLSGWMGYLYFNHVDPDRYTAAMIKDAVDRATALRPDSTEAQFAQAEYRYRVLRDFAGAERIYESLLKAAPNDHDVLQLLGLVERRLGRWEESLGHLEKASALDPRNPGLMIVIGAETLGNMRRYAEGLDWLDRALRIAPANPYALFNKIVTFQNQGALDEAARVIASLPKGGVDPSVVYAVSYQRVLERRYGDVAVALEPLLAQPDSELNGYGPLMRLQLGFAQRASGDVAGAQATFRDLIARIEPMARVADDSQVPVTLARAYAYAGDQKAALDQARLAVDLFGNDAIQRPVAELALAEVQMLGGDLPAAIEGLRHSLQVPSGVTAALLRLDPAWDPLRNDPAFQALLNEPASPTRKVGPN